MDQGETFSRGFGATRYKGAVYERGSHIDTNGMVHSKQACTININSYMHNHSWPFLLDKNAGDILLDLYRGTPLYKDCRPNSAAV